MRFTPLLIVLIILSSLSVMASTTLNDNMEFYYTHDDADVSGSLSLG